MPIHFEPQSLTGNSSQQLLEHALAEAPHVTARGAYGRHGGERSVEAPRPSDAVEPGLCPSCGCIANHETTLDCIDNLRGIVADLTSARLRRRKRRRA